MHPKVVFDGKELIPLTPGISVSKICLEIYKRTGLDMQEFYITQNGKRVTSTSNMSSCSDIQVFLRVLGGKGGFGSMLRAIGAQIEKTTNREACRDLSGRRLRDINEEKRLKAWLEKMEDKDYEAEERRKRKLNKLLSVPKHEFKDSEYEAERAELTEKLSKAFEEGLKRAELKRKAVDNWPQNSKKTALWIDGCLDSSSSDDSDSISESGSEVGSSIFSDSSNESSDEKEKCLSSC